METATDWTNVNDKYLAKIAAGKQGAKRAELAKVEQFERNRHATCDHANGICTDRPDDVTDEQIATAVANAAAVMTAIEKGEL